MNEIPNCFYRVSVKALILDESRTKFLIVKEDNGFWELPGGGLDWGATPQEDLMREIEEEMGLKTTQIAEQPSYFFTVDQERRSDPSKRMWVANVLYETKVENLDFTPSDECVELMFADVDDIKKLEKVFPNVVKLAEVFDPAQHAVPKE